MLKKSSDEPVIGDLKLQDLNDIFRAVAPYLSDPADPLLASFGPVGGCVSDYDNSPNLQFYHYARRTGKKTRWGPETFWDLSLVYEETKSGDFDYETQIKETVTTHKPYMNAKKPIRRMARFKIASMGLTPDLKVNRYPVYQDILALRDRGQYFSEATSTLENWASAALDMEIRCRSCWKRSLIKSAAIRKFAEAEFDIAKLREKLTCSKCKKTLLVSRLYWPAKALSRYLTPTVFNPAIPDIPGDVTLT